MQKKKTQQDTAKCQHPHWMTMQDQRLSQSYDQNDQAKTYKGGQNQPAK